MKKLLSALFVLSLFGCNNDPQKKTGTVAAATAESLSEKYQLDKIKLPEGFNISVYAEVPNARSMALSPAGVLYVGNRSEDKVYAVVDADKNGRADKV